MTENLSGIESLDQTAVADTQYNPYRPRPDSNTGLIKIRTSTFKTMVACNGIAIPRLLNAHGQNRTPYRPKCISVALSLRFPLNWSSELTATWRRTRRWPMMRVINGLYLLRRDDLESDRCCFVMSIDRKHR